MARPLRITFPGAFYHVTSRGNERKDVFNNNGDRDRFLGYLESAFERYEAVIHAYCLMDNHYHLLLETPSGNLPQIRRHINGAYTTYFNVKWKRAGHLFQGRYKAILVDIDEYAKELSRYIHLNPVRAELIQTPEDYDWTSYQFYIGRRTPSAWLFTDFILGYFGQKPSTARKNYRNFVNDQLEKDYDSPLKQVVSSTILGSQDFITHIKDTYLSKKKPDKNLPALKQLSERASIQDIINEVEFSLGVEQKLSREVKLYLCRKLTGEKLKTIGKYFGIGESGVSQAFRRVSKKIHEDKKLRKKIQNVEKKILQ